MNILQRLKLRLGLQVCLGERTQEGWSGALPFYAFKCPVHGLVENYPSGWAEILRCPLCIEAQKPRDG